MSDLDVSDIRAFIPAKDFARAKRFYAALGWDTHDVGPGIALVRLGNRQHFYIQDYYLKDVAENSMLHITVGNAQAWYRHAAAVLRDGDFPEARVQAPIRQAYGATVTFLHDPTGVLLHLCQWDEPAEP